MRSSEIDFYESIGLVTEVIVPLVYRSSQAGFQLFRYWLFLKPGLGGAAAPGDLKGTARALRRTKAQESLAAAAARGREQQRHRSILLFVHGASLLYFYVFKYRP
jgi:hypothetical protein